jgi:hypothetical protein
VYEEDLTNLDEWLRRLKVEYSIYFNGHRKKPPEDLKARVEKLVKRLSEVQNMSYSERFRYNTLITRFYVLRDLWRRTLMQRELSGAAEEAAAAAQSAAAAASLVRVSIVDPESEEGKVHELYDALIGARKKNAKEAVPISYPHFARYIARQIRSIRDKHDCTGVVFTVAVEEDAIRFTAAADTPQE